ncbi:MAG: hypothetical protein ABFD52_05735 [Acidobacteriota bacterium]
MAHLKITIQSFDIFSHHIQAGVQEHLVVRANLIIERDGESAVATAHLKETPGGKFVPEDTEVWLADGYRGPLNFRIFREQIATAYYQAIQNTFHYDSTTQDFGLEQFTLALNPPYVFEMETE